MDLCTLLEDHGLLSHAQAEVIRAAASQTSDPLVRHLMESRIVPETNLVRALALETGCEVLDPSSAMPGPDIVRLVPWDLASRHMVLPLRIRPDLPGSPLEIVLADPLDQDLIDRIEELVEGPVVVALAKPSLLARAIERAYSGVVTRVVHRGDQGADQPPRKALEHRPSDLHDEPSGPITIPSHSLLDEAGLSVKLSALLDVLEEKGIVTREEYMDRIRRLLEEGGGHR